AWRRGPGDLRGRAPLWGFVARHPPARGRRAFHCGPGAACRRRPDPVAGAVPRHQRTQLSLPGPSLAGFFSPLQPSWAYFLLDFLAAFLLDFLAAFLLDFLAAFVPPFLAAFLLLFLADFLAAFLAAGAGGMAAGMAIGISGAAGASMVP